MADLSRVDFNNANQFVKSSVQTLEDALMMLADLIKHNERYKDKIALGRWIEAGNGMVQFKIQGKNNEGIISDVKRRLAEEKIPYMQQLQYDTILIRDCDLERLKTINREAAISSQKYFQEVGLEEFERVMSNKKINVNERKLFKITGLTYEEAEVLRRKCNKVSQGFMVATGESSERGKYDLALREDQVFIPDAINENGDRTINHDFATAYLKMSFSLYGPNEELKKRQLKHDRDIEVEAHSLKDMETIRYIVGEDDPNQYIELDDEGFTHYMYIDDKNGERKKIKRGMCEKEDPSYDEELQRAMDAIFDKVFIDSEKQVIEHINSGAKDDIKSEREKLRGQALANNRTADEVCDLVDKMIEDKIRNNGITMQSVEAFHYYQKEAQKILMCYQKGKIHPDYKKEDFIKLKGIFEKYGTDIKDYQKAIRNLSEDRFTVKKYEPRVHTQKVREAR